MIKTGKGSRFPPVDQSYLQLWLPACDSKISAGGADDLLIFIPDRCGEESKPEAPVSFWFNIWAQKVLSEAVPGSFLGLSLNL